MNSHLVIKGCSPNEKEILQRQGIPALGQDPGKTHLQNFSIKWGNGSVNQI